LFAQPVNAKKNPAVLPQKRLHQRLTVKQLLLSERKNKLLTPILQQKFSAQSVKTIWLSRGKCKLVQVMKAQRSSLGAQNAVIRLGFTRNSFFFAAK
jgi:hypothetical protein